MNPKNSKVMKKILVVLGVISMTVMMSSCFGPSYWDDPYYYGPTRVVVVDGHHHHVPAPVHRPAPRHRGRW